MTARQYLAACEPYGYLADPRLDARFWIVVGLRYNFDSQIAKHLLQALCERYIAFQRSRSTTDRLRAWRAVRRCQGWFSQLTGRSLS
jgi:hypothetical protein